MEQEVSLWMWLVWFLKVLILALLVGIPFLVVVVLVSQGVYNRFFKKVEKRLEERYKQRGFTLIEVLVVLIILGLIAALVVPRITGRVDEAKVETTKIQLRAIKDALEQYKLDNGMYPTTQQGLKALVEKPTTPPVPRRWRQYLDKVPRDGWDREFIYISPGVNRPYELKSKGADGEEGTEDDIDVWNL